MEVKLDKQIFRAGYRSDNNLGGAGQRHPHSDGDDVLNRNGFQAFLDGLSVPLGIGC